MATLFISEAPYRHVYAMPLAQAATQEISIGAESTQSAAVAASTQVVRLYADADCRVAAGADPDATDGVPLAADAPEYFTIFPGEKIAVIER